MRNEGVESTLGEISVYRGTSSTFVSRVGEENGPENHYGYEQRRDRE